MNFFADVTADKGAAKLVRFRSRSLQNKHCQLVWVFRWRKSIFK